MAKSKVNKQRKQIKRTTRHFQLRVEHPKDKHVAEVLDYARTQRREVTVIREAITLYWALENNDLSVLFEMFPHLKPQVAHGAGGIDEIKAMLEMIARQQKASTEYVMPSPVPGTANPKLLAAPHFAVPLFEEDDEPTVLIRASTSTDSSLNFVTALRSMQ